MLSARRGRVTVLVRWFAAALSAARTEPGGTASERDPMPLISERGIAGHLRGIFDHALDAVVGMDASGTVIAWNPSAEQHLGWTAEEAVGRNMGRLIVPHQHRAAHHAGLVHYNRTGSGPVLGQRLKVTALHKDGSEFPIELSILPVEAAGGETVFYAFIRSLAAEQHAERELARRAQEAEVLAGIAYALLDDVSTDDLIRLCLARICEVSGWIVGHLYELDRSEQPERLVSSDIWHLGRSDLEAVVDASRLMSFRLGEGLPGRVWLLNDAVHIEALATEANFPRKAVCLAAGLSTAFAFPVHGEGDDLSVMEFFGTDHARADPELFRFARTVSSYVSLALQMKRESDARNLLRREMAHRVSNSLAVLSSLFRRCAAGSGSVEQLVVLFEPRLQAVARAHLLTGRSGNACASLFDIVEGAVDLIPERAAVHVDGPDVQLEASAVQPLSLVLNELATNSIKYGKWHRGGTLSVGWSVAAAAGDLEVTWREEPGSLDGSHEGFGSQLIRAMVASLGGTFSRTSQGGAFIVSISIPRDRWTSP